MEISLQVAGSVDVVIFRLTDKAKNLYNLNEDNPRFAGKLLTAQLMFLVQMRILDDFKIGRPGATDLISVSDEAWVMAKPGQPASSSDIARASVELGKVLGALALVDRANATDKTN